MKPLKLIKQSFNLSNSLRFNQNIFRYQFQTQKNYTFLPKFSFSNQAQNYLYLGQHFLSQNDLEKAEYYLKETETSIPDNPDLLSSLDFQKAKQYFQRTIDLTDSSLCHANMGIIYMQEQNFDLGEQSFLYALEKGQDRPEIYFYLAQIYLKKMKTDKFQEMLKKVEEKDPAEAQKLLKIKQEWEEKLGKEYLKLSEEGKINQQSDSQQSQTSSIQDGSILIQIFGLIQENRISEAENLAQNMLKNNPNSYYGSFCLAMVYSYQYKYKESQQILEKLINGNSNQLPQVNILPPDIVILTLIEICLKGNSLNDAEKYLLQLKKTSPNSKEIFYLEGFLCEQRGNIREAENLLKQVPIESQYLSEAYLKLGTIYVNQQRYDEAKQQYIKGMNINGRNFNFPFNLGGLHHQIGKYQEAALYYNQSIGLNNSFAPAHYQLGQVYVKLNQKAEALQSFKRAYELDPSMIKK